MDFNALAVQSTHGGGFGDASVGMAAGAREQQRGPRGRRGGGGSARAAVAPTGARARGAVRGVSLIVTKCGRCRPRCCGRVSIPKGERNRPTLTTTLTHSLLHSEERERPGAEAAGTHA